MKSPITLLFILANVFVYFATFVFTSLLDVSPFSLDSSGSHWIYERFGLVPAEFLKGAYWQPITSPFLHVSSSLLPLHLIFNMVGLASLGFALERIIGSLNLFFLYLFSVLGSSALVLLSAFLWGADIDLNRITIGASGAVLGVLGGVAVFIPKLKLFLLFIPISAVRAAFVIGILSIICIVFDFFTILSHEGHLGGLLCGFLYAKYVLQLTYSTKSRSSLDPYP